MAVNGGKINFQVGYNVDQASVNALKKSLQDLQKIKVGDFKGAEEDLADIKMTAREVQKALSQAFNPQLNTINLKTFNQQLLKTERSLDSVYKDFSKAGQVGKNAFGELARNIINTNTKLTQTKTLLQSMGQTMMNTVKWGIASSVMNTFTGAVKNAFSYVKSLDSALTDIRIVTGDSTEQMKQFAVQANNAAQALGRSTMDYTKAALTFYQQGLDDQSVQARTEATLKAQNITGAGDQMADYLTAVWNGYRVANEEAQLYVDKLAAVADSSASNMSQLAVAMSKVASTARAMGVDVDSLNAQIATIVGTTRQAPESVGNALKTIYARINDIATGADDAQVSLGNYSQKMAQVGFSVLDANGNLRDTGQVIDQIGGKWETLSREQQIYLARTMAGQRQYNNLIALFDNWNRYTDLVNVSLDSQGTLMQKNSRYMDSLEAKMQQLGAAGERFKDALINEEDLKGITQFGTKAVNIFASLVEGLGGGKNAFLAFGSVISGVFSNIIGKEIGNIINKNRELKASSQALIESVQKTASFENTAGYKEDPIFKQYIDNSKRMQQIWSVMSKDQIKMQENNLNEIRSLEEKAQGYEKAAEAGQKLVDSYRKNIKGIKDSNFDLTKYDLSEEFQKQIKGIISDADELKETINKIFSGDISAENWDPFKSLIEEMRTKSGVEFSEQLKNIFNKSFDEVSKDENALKIIQQYLGKIKEAADGALNFRNFTLGAQDARDQAGAIRNEFQAIQKSAEVIFNSQAMTKLASGIGRVVSGVSSITNLFKTWKDTGISTGQKLVQTFTTLGFVLPSITSGVKDIKKGLQAFPGIIKQLSDIGLKKLSKDGIEATLVNKNLAKSQKDAGKAATEQAGKEVAAAAGIEVEGDEAAAAAPKNVTFAGSVWAAVAPLLIIVGAIAAVGVALYALYKDWNKEAEAAKKANQVAASTKQRFEEVKQAYDDLKQSLEDYNAAQEAIDSMTRGTQQWADAIQQANDNVLQLLNNYPLLAQYISTGQDGRLIISQAGQDAVLNYQQQAVNYARIASTEAARDARDASAKATAAAIGHNSYFTEQMQDGTYQGQFATAEAVENVIKHLDDLRFEEGDLQNHLSDAADQMAALAGISKEQAQAILENSDQLFKLKRTMQENEKATQLAYKALAGQALSDNQYYSNSDAITQDAMSTMLGKTLDASTKKIQEDWEQKLTEGVAIWSGASNERVQEMLDKFNQANGTNWGLASNAVRGTDTNRSFAFINEQGQQVVYTKEQIAATIAAKQALEGLGQSAKNVQKMFNQLQNIGQGNEAQAIKNLIAGRDLSSMTEAEINALNFDTKQFAEYFDRYKEQFNQLEYKTVDELTKAANTLKDSSLEKLKNITNGYGKSVQNAFKDLNLSGFGYSVQKQVIDTLNEAFIKGKGLKGFQTTVANVLQDALNADKLEELLNQDFSNMNLDALKETLSKLGIATNASDEALKIFLNTMKKIPELTAQEIYNNVHSVIDKKSGKTLEYNDQLNEEDYNKLKQAGVAVDNAFVRLTSGMYKFVGDAEQFYNKANQASLKPFFDQIDEVREKINLVGNGFSYEDLSKQSYQLQPGTTQKIVTTVDYNLVQQQVDALKATDLISDEDFAKYNDLIKLQQMDYESLQQIQSQIQNNSQRVGEYAENAKKAYQEDLHAQQMTLAYSQQDIGQLQDVRNAGYLDQLLSTKQGIEEYTMAVLSAADAQGLQKQNIETLAQAFIQTASSMENVNDALEGNKKSSYQIASVIEDLITGVESIQKAWKETISEGVQPSTQVLQESRKAISDMFNQDISSEQIVNHLDLIKSIAEGDVLAVNQLGVQLANLRIENDIAPRIDFTNFDFDVQSLMNMLSSTDWGSIQIGTQLDNAPFEQALANMVNAAGLGQQQINDLLGLIGYSPQIEWRTITADDVNAVDGVNYYQYNTLEDGQVKRITLTDYQNSQLAAGHEIKIPIIKGSKFAGGNLKDFGGSRVTPKAPKTTSPKGGKSGGGSSKKPTQVKLAEAKNSEENKKQKVRDPYEQVQKAYERQEQLLDNLQDKEKKLLDRDRVKLLKEQAEELRKQNQIIQERLDISNSAKGDIWKTDPKTTLEYRKWLQANLGARFDDDGHLASRTAAENKAIQNYNKALADADARYNKQIDSYNKWITNVYNKASAERQQQLKTLKEKKDAEKQRAEENHKTDLKNAEELYKKSIDNLNNYQKKWQDDQKDRKTQRQNDWKAYQNLIESSRIQIKLKVDSGQLERDWLDFEKKFIKKVSDDDILGNAKHSIKELMSYIDSGEIAARNKVIEDIRKSIENIQAGGVDDLYGQNIVKAREDLDALIKDQQDDLLKIQDIVDEVKNDYLDMIDKANDKMQQQVDQYERVNSLIDHDVKLLELIYGDKGLETRQKYYELQKANNQQELDSLKKQQDYWRERMSQQVIGSDAWNKFKQNLDDVTDDLNSKLENMIDERTKQWQNSVNIIINNLNNSLTNGLGTNFLDEQWDYMSDFDDKFLDTFNSTVGVQDVERLYNQALEGVAGNPKAQQRINNLMKEQLKILKEKDNLTQYDLERAKAMLQVEQARMDLEDARNNKTKMRLRRDSQGNYTYQYVADEEKLTDLQQALADAQTNLYNMDKNHYKQNLEDMNQAYRDFLGKQQQLQDELARAMAAGDEAEAERVRNRLNLLEQSYDKMYSALLEDNQYLLEYLGSSFADGMGIDRAAQSAEQFAQTMKDNIPYVASSIQNMVNNIRDLGGLLPATAGAITGIADAANAWQQDVNKTLETAGTSASDIMNVTDAEGKALDNNIQTTRELITANDALIASTKLEIEAMQELLSNMDDILAKNFQFDELVKNLREAYNLAQTLYGSTVTADQIPVAQNNVDTTFNSPEDAKAYYTTLAERAQEKFDSGELLVDNDIAQILSDRLKSNQMSTEELANLIRVSEYIQSITSSMGNLFSHEITSLDSGIGEILSTTTDADGKILDQNVHIDANFPNVTDHNQIEQAFNNLVNIASMYASKRY